MRSLMRGLGVEFKIRLKSDATAAICIVARQGLGRVRHLAVSYLWVQQADRQGEIEFSKVDGTRNPADTLTKAVEREVMERQMLTLHVTAVPGRAECAPAMKLGKAGLATGTVDGSEAQHG